MRSKSLAVDGGAFAAIDFETADYGRDSACSLSIVRANPAGIQEQTTFLIRPPRRDFVFTYIHGISWSDVSGQPTFKGHWPEIRKILDGVSFLSAHNASFDRSVMAACCREAGVDELKHPYLCTVKLARTVWSLRPTTLPDVCRHLRIPLKHHDAASDAFACAKIVLAAIQDGAEIGEHLAGIGAPRRHHTIHPR
jgi:DNA polymerase-3 subunit epsilon